MKLVVVAACSAFAIGGTEATAQQRQTCTGPQLGTWKLETYTSEDIATHEVTNPLGMRPSGYISYGPDCRMYVIMIQEGRKAPASLVPTQAERLELYGSLTAYAGTYAIEGDEVAHHIDTSWNQAWTGTTQTRKFRIDGRTLRITTVPSPNPLTGRESVRVLTWTKVE